MRGRNSCPAAHDLRSPLTSILTLAEALRSEQSGPVNDLQRRQLGFIYSAALALNATASDFIEVAHGGDRLARTEPSPFFVGDRRGRCGPARCGPNRIMWEPPHNSRGVATWRALITPARRPVTPYDI